MWIFLQGYIYIKKKEILPPSRTRLLHFSFIIGFPFWQRKEIKTRGGNIKILLGEWNPLILLPWFSIKGGKSFITWPYEKQFGHVCHYPLYINVAVHKGVDFECAIWYEQPINQRKGWSLHVDYVRLYNTLNERAQSFILFI